MEYEFIAPDRATADLFKALGFAQAPGFVPDCPMQVGDVIVRPGSTTAAIRVRSRRLVLHEHGMPTWQVVLEPCALGSSGDPT